MRHNVFPHPISNMKVFQKFLLFSKSRRDISYYPLKIFWYTGLHPKHKSRFVRVLFYFNILGLCMWLTLGAVGVKISLDNGDLNYMVECLQTCILIVHCIGKYGAIMLDKTTLGYLVDQTSNFWHLDEFSSEVRGECRKILDLATLFVNSCVLFGVIVCLFFYIQPFVTGNLPTVCYEPPGWHLFLILSFWYLMWFFMFGGIVGTNTYFCGACLPLIVQFKLLKHTYQTLSFKHKDERQIWDELKRLINYHQFLLEYANRINELAQTVFLLECLVSVITSCLGLFIVMHDEIPLGNKLKCSIYFMGEIIGTGIFCFSAQLVYDASSEIANAIYSSSWYESDVISVRKAINMLVMRSQKAVVFTGHGFIVLNAATYTMVFKSILSFYTYLKTMEKRKMLNT